ncbi:MAG: NAD(P)/FAD-dependent oxidoreductase [Bryobacteraceae bacterium]
MATAAENFASAAISRQATDYHEDTEAMRSVNDSEVVIVGGGPAGLSAAEAIARRGHAALVLEQNHEIGSPIRTSGGSFIDELKTLGIPPHLYHPITRVRFLSPANEARFDYPEPKLCVMDVRGVFQHLAMRAVDSGARIRTNTRVTAPVMENGAVKGVRIGDETIGSQVVIDATGYRAAILKQAGLDPSIQRFGVGAEYDFYAPHCDESEVLLFAGSELAPAGYAWVFPWGHKRVRVGVGIIHPDSKAKPEEYLDYLVDNLDRFGVNMKGAQPIEHHFGLIPSECFAAKYSGDGILGAGDAAGHASSLVGEGIRWAIQAGRMAGEIVANALDRNDVSRDALVEFERKWEKRYGRDLRVAHILNERMARWDDRKWDERMEVVKRLTPHQFIEALKTNLTGGWLLRFLASNPKTIAEAAGIF